MVSWKITATTVHCHEINGYVSIMVSGNGKASCTGHLNMAENVANGCQGIQCNQVESYRQKLFAEEG